MKGLVFLDPGSSLLGLRPGARAHPLVLMTRRHFSSWSGGIVGAFTRRPRFHPD